MAGPVVTTLLSPNPASGTWQPTTLGIETTLASGTASGTFLLEFDLGATGGVANADVILIRVYKSADGTNLRVHQNWLAANGGPAPIAANGDPMIWPGAVPIPCVDLFKVTATLVAGGVTSRNFPWRVINLNGV